MIWVECIDMSFRYKKGNPILFSHVNFGLDSSSRICIVGANGSGKVEERNDF